MKVYIKINLCATLSKFMPECADNYSIERGTTISDLLEHLGVPKDDVKFVFISGSKGDSSSLLYGGEKVAVFPTILGG